MLEHIGEGSFGKVYKARRKNTGFTVAMKFITKHGKSDKDIRTLRQEIGILRKLNHENIILMFDAFETDREFCVVTEYAQGELFDILQVITKPHPSLIIYPITSDTLLIVLCRMSISYCHYTMSLFRQCSFLVLLLVLHLFSFSYRMTNDCPKAPSNKSPNNWSKPFTISTPTASYTAT